jgi:hypothetical protein
VKGWDQLTFSQDIEPTDLQPNDAASLTRSLFKKILVQNGSDTLSDTF